MMSYSPRRASLESNYNSDCQSDWDLEYTITRMFDKPRRKETSKEEIVKKESDYGKTSKDEISSILIGASLRKYSYSELRAATDGFSARYKIGKGGTSDVYKGRLKCSGDRKKEVKKDAAVKVFRFKSGSDDSLEMECCKNEINVMSKLGNNCNLVQLLGGCHEGEQLALVYEYVPNGTLSDHLHGTGFPLLPWEVRYRKIALGVVSALESIHEPTDWGYVIHRDVKTCNVFLDSDLNPKLADFGVAKLLDRWISSASDTKVCGTSGYIDPDYYRTGVCTTKSDIYALGVVALEIATGRKVLWNDKGENFTLPRWVNDLYVKGDILEAADPRLGKAFVRREMQQLLLLGLLCTKEDPNLRPSASLIIRYLNFEDQMPLDANFSRFSATATCSLPPALFATPEEIPNHAASSSVKEEEKEEIDSNLVAPLENGNPVATTADGAFDIGIPSHYYNSTATTDVFFQQRQDYHLTILYGMVDTLAKMLISEQPPFDKVLESIRTFTACLVKFVPPPLDDWDALAQLVLQRLSSGESSVLLYKNSCSFPGEATSVLAISSSSLLSEIEKSAPTVEKDKARLKDARERLAREREECSVLEAKLEKARENCRSIEEEVKAIEQRVTPAQANLEQKRRRYAIIKRFESALSPL